MQHAAPVAPQTLVHGVVNIAPVVLGETLRGPETPVDRQCRRIELDDPGVGPATESEPVVETLLEHAQGGDLAARFRPLGNGGGSDPFGSPELARYATGRDAGDDGEVEVGLEVPHGPERCRRRALGLPVEAIHDPLVDGPREFLVGLGVVFRFDPANFAVDAVHRLEVPLVVVVPDFDIHFRA